MTAPIAIIAVLTLAAAVTAMSLRNLVHCALMFMAALAGVAALYLGLGAQFVGFAQVLIYFGAVAILIVFAILLTRGTEPPREPILSKAWITGIAIAVVVFGVLSAMVLSSKALTREPGPTPQLPVHQLGAQLMTKYVLPLEVIGLLLTAALIGAVVIAMHDEEGG
ncbi:MAG TPA: NADH-quinone oxidoreductase subunit J [Candidatus Acidoferrum sp.]|nr:NADH-quinone oxidoreductase subunit J [Candidatus Acidoferrum sp.]